MPPFEQLENGAFAGYSFVDVPDMRYKFVNLEGYRGAEGVGVGTPAVPSPAIFKLTSRKRSRMVALSRGFQVPSLGVGGGGGRRSSKERCPPRHESRAGNISQQTSSPLLQSC